MDQQLRSAIIQELGLQSVSEDVADTVITKLGGLIMEDVVLSAAEGLSDENLEAFEQVIASQDHAKVEEFLVKHVPNVGDLLVSSSKKIVEEYKKI